ncbi:hypothetical protein BHK98_08120 [Hornefia porci]|uniref:DUF2148 domain-containing protein n=1 Tax=Hornefia porci TaxID=2652292 RepID=A0A1Q9JII9_9FIRM|nr:DUF2148 domain-containing protein [Hornefia porci]OLR56029.1 hypothetical protein BHK98_08120 [Hornefia porci]
MLRYVEDMEAELALATAEKMVAAIKTAPKASGQDKVVAAIASGSDKDRIVRKMRKLGEEYEEEFITRDAGCLEKCKCVVLVGVRDVPHGLDHCGMCGFENCAELRKAGGNCALTTTDLGIAIGSAVSIAADSRVDNRVMYSVGKAVSQMDIFPSDVRVCYGIPLSISAKSIFFDRGPGAVLISGKDE